MDWHNGQHQSELGIIWVAQIDTDQQWVEISDLRQEKPLTDRDWNWGLQIYQNGMESTQLWQIVLKTTQSSEFRFREDGSFKSPLSDPSFVRFPEYRLGRYPVANDERFGLEI